MTFNANKKHKKHAFGKDIYFLGQDADGTNYWLEAASWDCNWYWGFGYIESYTNNINPERAKNISSHEHFSGLNQRENINLYDAFKKRFVSHPFSDEELWTICELMESFYTAQEYARMLNLGGSNYTAEPCYNIIRNKDEEKRINTEVIPSIASEVYKLMSPDTNKKNR